MRDAGRDAARKNTRRRALLWNSVGYLQSNYVPVSINLRLVVKVINHLGDEAM